MSTKTWKARLAWVADVLTLLTFFQPGGIGFPILSGASGVLFFLLSWASKHDFPTVMLYGVVSAACVWWLAQQVVSWCVARRANPEASRPTINPTSIYVCGYQLAGSGYRNTASTTFYLRMPVFNGSNNEVLISGCSGSVSLMQTSLGIVSLEQREYKLPPHQRLEVVLCAEMNITTRDRIEGERLAANHKHLILESTGVRLACISGCQEFEIRIAQHHQVALHETVIDRDWIGLR